MSKQSPVISETLRLTAILCDMTRTAANGYTLWVAQQRALASVDLKVHDQFVKHQVQIVELTHSTQQLQ
jgi:hypothetical protein